MYLLDTNVVSELRRTQVGRAHPRVAAWAARTDPLTMFVSVLTIMEAEIGILLIERRDKPQGARLRRWFEEQLLPSFSERALPVDVPVARGASVLHVPNPRPERDALIAATAIKHGLTVVTRNVADFVQTGAPTIDPWTA